MSINTIFKTHSVRKMLWANPTMSNLIFCIIFYIKILLYFLKFIITNEKKIVLCVYKCVCVTMKQYEVGCVSEVERRYK
jgi:hypothetical protein